MPVNTTIKIRKGTESEWTSSNPVLASGEPGFVTDANRFKIGDGNTSWNSLSYAAVVPSGFIAGSGIDLNLGPNGSFLNIGISGSFVASTGYFDVLSFNTNIEPALLQGQIAWNNTEGTVDIALTDTTIINIGEHEIYRVRNDTGVVLYKGQAVMASGVHANGIIIPNLYTANSSVREIRFMGLVYENINNNNNGYVIHFGHINNIDTRGNVVSNIAVGDETWNDGDILYVHPTVAGKLTKVEPKHSIAAAIILDAASNGKIFVRPISYGHLGDNHDVSISGATNGQFLQYNSATDYWVPSSSGNFTTLLVNGTGVSVSGHTHLVNDITNFASGVADEVSTTITAGTGINLNYDSGTDMLTVSVTGLISNAANNRILTSRDNTTTGIDAESNLTFDGNTFVCSGNARIGDYQYIDVDGGLIYIKNADNSTIMSFEEYSLWDSSQQLSIYWDGKQLVNGSDVVLDWSNNKVGIKTVTPVYTLDVNGSGNFASGLAISNQTASTIAGFDSNKNVTSLSTSTYPSLTELSYVKGVTSAIQTQLNNKQATLTNPVTGTGVISHIAYWNSSSGIVADSGQLYWDSTNDRLGIGTSSPSQKISINGNALIGTESSTRILVNGAGGSAAVAEFYQAESNARWAIGRDLAGGGIAGIGFATNGTLSAVGAAVAYPASRSLGLYTSNATSLVERVRISSDGNVGIGTTSPTSSLTVSGIIQLTDTAGNRVQFFRGGGTQYDYSIAKEGNHLAVSTANDGSTFRYTQFGYHSGSTWIPKTVINNYNGNIGIGTSSPTVTLHAIGSGIFTSGVQVGDSSSNAYLIGPSGNTYIRFNNGAFNWIELASNTYSGSSTYLSTQYSYLNSAATYVNGAFQFPKAGNVPTSTATQRDSNSIIMYNRLWNGSAESAPGNEILSKASTSVNLRSRFSFLMQNEDGTANRTERFSILSNGYVGVGNAAPSYSLDVVGTGNFSQNLLVNGTGVSISGHTHVVNDITDFSTGVADEVNTTLTAGSGIVLDYDSGTDTLTIHTSGVRSKTLTYFTPLDNQPPASAFATLDTRNSIAVLDFDDTTEESAVFVGVIPENAALGSGISVRIHWMATSATTGSCRWGVQFEKMNTDLDSDSFDTATEAHSTTNGTSGIITITSITCTSIDSLSAGDLFRIKIYRDVTDTTNDTMTGDAEVAAIELRSVL